MVRGSSSIATGDESNSTVNKTKTKQSKPPKAQRQKKQKEPTPPWVMASCPKTFGWASLYWFFYTALRLYNRKWIKWPAPRFVGNYMREAVLNIKYVNSIRKWVRGIIVSAALKGGTGKSTAASWLNFYFAWFIDLVSLGLDDDTSNTSLGRRHGIELDGSDALLAKQMMELILNHEFEPTKDQLMQLVAIDSLSKAYVLPNAEGVEINDEQMEKVVRTLKKPTDTLIIDAAPGIKEQNTIGAVKASGVTILSAHLNAEDDIHGITEALKYGPYKLRQRTDGHTTIVMLNSVTPKHFNRRTQYEMAEKFGLEPEHVVLIPYNQRLHDSQRVDSTKVPAKVHYAWTWLLRVVADALMSYNVANPRDELKGESEIRNVARLSIVKSFDETPTDDTADQNPFEPETTDVPAPAARS